MFRENHKLLPTPKTTGYQCDMLMAYPNAAIEYTTQGCVVTLCFCVKSEERGTEGQVPVPVFHDAYYHTGLGFKNELDIDYKRGKPLDDYPKKFELGELSMSM